MPYLKLKVVYLMDPSELVNKVAHLIAADNTLKDPVLSGLKAKFNQTTIRLREFVESEDLRDLGSMVDIDRFLSDPTYKTDTLLGLTLTSDPAGLQVAIKLAQKYDVPFSQIYLTSLQYLFDSSPSIDGIKEFINETDMMVEFRKNIEEFLNHMEINILISISGRDYERLTYFYSIMLDVGGQNQTYDAYLTILSYLTNNNISIDFNVFVGSNKKLLESLKPFFTSSNIREFASLICLLPDTGVTASAMYGAWALETFFAGCNQETTSRQWIARFGSVLDTFNEMDVNDIENFIEKMFLSKVTCHIPLAAKHEGIKMILKQCELVKLERPSACTTFNALIDRLAKIKSHFQHIDCPAFMTLIRSGPPLDEYARCYERSGGIELNLSQLSRQILLDKCSLTVLREVLAIYPEDCSFVPEDIFEEVLQNVLDEIISGKDLFGILEHLLVEFVTYSDEGGELILEDDIVDKIRSSTSDPQAAVDCKVKILNLAQKYLELDSGDVDNLHALKTGEIVQTVLSFEIHTEDVIEVNNYPETHVETEEEKLQLLEKLLNATKSSAQAYSIFELLSIWSPFDTGIYIRVETNPWSKLINKLITTSLHNEDRLTSIKLIHSIINHSTVSNQLNGSLLNPIMSILIRSGERDCLLEISKIAFSYCDHQRIHEAIDMLNSQSGIPFDEEFFEIILKQKLVPSILPSSFYGEFFSYLTENGNSESIWNAANQLQENGNIIEAASIRLMGSLLPNVFRTASIPFFNILSRFN